MSANKSPSTVNSCAIKLVIVYRCWLDYANVLMWAYVCPAAGFILVSDVYNIYSQIYQ